LNKVIVSISALPVCLIGCIVILNSKIALPQLAKQPTQKQSEDWKPSTLPKHEIDDALKALADRSPWVPDAQAVLAHAVEANNKPLTPPNWKIMGVVKQASGDFILLNIVGQPTTQVRVGETLPGGARILAIEQDHVCLLLNGKRRSLRIYTQ
jgi:hypothetical protein